MWTLKNLVSWKVAEYVSLYIFPKVCLRLSLSEIWGDKHMGVSSSPNSGADVSPIFQLDMPLLKGDAKHCRMCMQTVQVRALAVGIEVTRLLA
jgi:hypothetical protein